MENIESPAASSSERAFWEFSLFVYGREAVHDLCLALQDEHGFDVNLLLFCLWIADVQQKSLDRASIDRLRAATAPWMDDVVIPLRTIRRRLKQFHADQVSAAEAEGCRRIIKDAELEGERIEQLILVRALDLAAAQRFGSPREAAEASFAAYAEALAAPGARPSLAKLIAAIF